MSTKDVPGARKSNNDVLAMGCWAEHKDGSLVFVESVEGGRTIYSIFDLSKDPPVEYRDAMPTDGFKKHFSWVDGSNTKKVGVKWTWHDKTPFPWDRVIKQGVTDGMRYPSAHDQISAAEKVANSLKLKGANIHQEDMKHFQEKVRKAGESLMGGIQKALDELGA